jgi:hypothetical protein
MTVADGSADDADPLAYEPGDRIGLCLDIDGTLYRSGSVFIETLAFLPYADGIALTPAERRHRRTALAAVAEYHGGWAGRVKWRGVLAALDVLRARGRRTLSETVLETLARRRADGLQRGDAPGSSRSVPISGSDYQRMRETVLAAYGRLLRGRRRADVTNAVERVVGRRCDVPARLRATLDRLARRADADLFLVTDMPDHVGAAYARQLDAVAGVVGVTYGTDDADRYTGEFARVEKGTTVSRLRNEREWDYVLAAGDSPVDFPMADESDCFLAVTGRSNLTGRLRSDDTASPRGSAADLRTRLAPDRNVVRVPRDEAFGAAFRTTLRAVGISAE